MSYDPRVIRRLINIGRRRNVGREAILGALATGIVESGLTNIHGGDADSSGWRQERASLYPNPNNLRASINRFYDEWGQHDTPGFNPGQTAANVQRPAEQYRGRYAEQMEEARRLLAQYGGGAIPGGTPGSGVPVLGQVTNPIEQIAALNQGDPQNPYNDLMQRGWQLLSQAWEQQNPQTVELGSDSFLSNLAGAPANVNDPGYLGQIARRMANIDKANNAGDLPYDWGGGHQRKGGPLVPLDCSGAVSRVLGINPLVAEQFMSWGEPGRGQRVTIWAKGDHVLMEKDGRFWGTSGSNPGGGAGWIPASAISEEYLSQFTPRHPRGL